VLAVSRPEGLTDLHLGLTGLHLAGKTGALCGSKQGMTTRPHHTTGACQAQGPPVDVLAWRACRLREAGFAPALAEEVAAQRVDLHALLQLVDAGCPPDLAVRILSPLEDPVRPR
jgi:hypothetical protein